MLKKCLISIILGIFLLNFSYAENAGFVLLDELCRVFQGMATQGSGGKENIDKTLEKMMADTKKAKTQKYIDSVFFNRFNRVLMVLKLSIVEDQEGILGSLFEQEVGKFVADILGEKIDVTDRKAIGKIASAVAEETLNLHMYLDNRKKRDELMKEYEKKYGMSPGKKEKK